MTAKDVPREVNCSDDDPEFFGDEKPDHPKIKQGLGEGKVTHSCSIHGHHRRRHLGQVDNPCLEKYCGRKSSLKNVSVTTMQPLAR